MASINKAILIGNLGKDPELRYTPQGRPVANFSIATTERWTSKSGEKQEKTEWHNIVLWDRQAEIANQYLKKGSSCYIEGRITNRAWEDKDKVKRYRTEIIGQTMQFIGAPAGGGGRGDHQSAAPQQPDEYFDPLPDAMADNSPPGAGDDDLPF
jgi:single-strand DNA-binding protein